MYRRNKRNFLEKSDFFIAFPRIRNTPTSNQTCKSAASSLPQQLRNFIQATQHNIRCCSYNKPASWRIGRP